VTLDFRMSTTCLYSDIVLPTATWYEKNDLNTSDMHPFIHPAVGGGRSGLAVAQRLGNLQGLREEVQRGLRRPPGCRTRGRAHPDDARHPGELAQPFEVKDWKRGETDLIPGKTAPQVAVVERDYPNVYKRFTALGPLMGKVGNGGKGIGWNTQDEVKQLGELNGLVHGPKARPAACRRSRPISTPAKWCCNSRRKPTATSPSRPGKRSASRPGAITRIWRCTARTRRSASATSRRSRARSSARRPGAASSRETVSYNAGYTNVHELIPWRTLTGRQQFYLDHPWMIAFGEGFSSYRPPVDLKTTAGIHGIKPQWQPGDPAQLHHAAPEVGDPLDLHRQPADADAEPWRADHLVERRRRQARRHRR
jgi:nitrate reductase alpha subunit